MHLPRASALSLLTAALLASAGLAHAERPMNVDDAGTLPKGGAKLEFGWSKDDRARGIEGAAGFAPIDNLEVEIGLARERDSGVVARGQGLALKWVPLQAETGLSAGLKYEYAVARAEGERTYGQALNGLVS